MRWSLLIVLAGCLARSQKVQLPDGKSALRITCNYTLDNCRREARHLCEDGYDELSRGNRSCHNCGWRNGDNELSINEASSETTQTESNVFKGVLYVRCR
jgi:hypothetical protein